MFRNEGLARFSLTVVLLLDMLLLPLLLLLFLLLPWRRRRAARKGADPETSLFQRKPFSCPRVGVGMRVGLGNANLQPPTLNRACACTCGLPPPFLLS